MPVHRLIFSFLVSLFFLALTPTPSLYAQEPTTLSQPQTLEATIINILEERVITPEYSENEQLYQKLELLVTKGALKNETIIVENGHVPMANLQQYQEGVKVIVTLDQDFEGNNMFYITDYVRRDSLLFLFIIFIMMVVIVGRWRGLASILSLGASFFIIFRLILPNILAGSDPILVAIIGSMFIIPITFYLSHGVNKKTTIAVAGTVIALIITGVLAGIFVESAKLTGFASEEAGFLQIAQDNINIKGLLLAGIIIGVLGVLDDITVSQSAIVFQLKKANPKLKSDELYRRAMDVGQDHISSMVNTLVLVYTGAALPLLLLFVDNPHPFTEIINYEIIADEIVRTLVGSIGLILAVPITTLIATLSLKRE